MAIVRPSYGPPRPPPIVRGLTESNTIKGNKSRKRGRDLEAFKAPDFSRFTAAFPFWKLCRFEPLRRRFALGQLVRFGPLFVRFEAAVFPPFFCRRTPLRYRFDGWPTRQKAPTNVNNRPTPFPRFPPLNRRRMQIQACPLSAPRCGFDSPILANQNTKAADH